MNTTPVFDIIVINPPYYKKDPGSYSDYAWNCGSNGEYFKKLFTQLRGYSLRNKNTDGVVRWL
jgi:hypothetical protein